MGLIEHKLEEAKLLKKTKRKVVKQGGCVNLWGNAHRICQDKS